MRTFKYYYFILVGTIITEHFLQIILPVDDMEPFFLLIFYQMFILLELLFNSVPNYLPKPNPKPRHLNKVDNGMRPSYSQLTFLETSSKPPVNGHRVS